MENVPEVLTGKYKGYFQEAAAELRRTGYNLKCEVLDLSLFGVPQRRRRAIILGCLKGSIEPPVPVFTKETARTVREAISHLNPISAGSRDPYDEWHIAPNHTPRILDRIRKTPPDGGDRRALPQSEQLACHRSVDDGETPGFTDVYGRLRWDSPSVTITAKSSTPSCGRFLHPEQDRNISVREAAILQGFPQRYAFEGPLVHQYRQIGEALPPLFACFLAYQVLEHLSPQSQTGPNPFWPLGLAEKNREVRRNGAPRVVDAFCGAGGLSLGMKLAGFAPAFAFDTDSDCIATLAQNLGVAARLMDVRDPLVCRNIDKAVGQTKYIVVGGPPCQGFSQQRRGDGDDPRNNLVVLYANLISRLRNRPLAVVLENVTYLDSPRGREVLAEYIRLMEAMHYVIRRHDLNSAEYGVPQLRHRIIVVALRESVNRRYDGPKSMTSGHWPTVRDALTGVPDISSSNASLAVWPNHEPSREGELNRRRIAYVDMGQGRMSIPLNLQLPCHTRYDGHLDVYGRLDWFSQARTITGGFDSFTRGEYAHPFRHRSITPREAARIQGFPDWFEFLGNRASIRRQIGNAVPPPLAFAVGAALLKAISALEVGGNE